MSERPTMNVSLTPELVDYVGDRVRSGRYSSASEVVRAALRLLQREEPASARLARGPARKTPSKASPHG
jgi:antitoxin ParD1/3/4